jgi:cobyrinic acid a,c-diamide synthase
MIPRLVIAGVSSSVGKTTVTVGLARALRARGLRVALFKCGPDYLDPTYHAIACGASSHNLDGWMMGREAVQATFARAAADADIALIEGVMGLFDGASPTGEEGSTAEIAKWLGASVLVVCDASGMARTIAAVGHGFATFDADLSVAGLVCNRLGSRGHLDLLRKASTLPIVGGLPRDAALAFPERHLGLRTAAADVTPEPLFVGWGRHTTEWFDLDRILTIAKSAQPLPAVRPTESSTTPRRCRIGVALDDAFHFYYDDNLRRLEQLGAELVWFSPLADARLPDVDGLYLGGGYPELHAEQLAQNRSLCDDIATFARAQRPIYAECGGLMYLCTGIRTLAGELHSMVGLVPAVAEMRDRLQALGYVEVETQTATALGPPGLRFRGHQFRYSELQLQGDVEHVYRLRKRRGGDVVAEGYRIGNTIASYVHVHWASNPLPAHHFVDACSR